MDALFLFTLFSRRFYAYETDTKLSGDDQFVAEATDIDDAQPGIVF